MKIQRNKLRKLEVDKFKKKVKAFQETQIFIDHSLDCPKAGE